MDTLKDENLDGQPSKCRIMHVSAISCLLFSTMCEFYRNGSSAIKRNRQGANKRFSILRTDRIFAGMDASNVPWASPSQPETIRSKRSKQILFLDIFKTSNSRKREGRPIPLQLPQVFISPRQHCGGGRQAFLVNIKSAPPHHLILK